MLTEAKCRAAMPGKRPDGSSEPTLLHDGRGLYLQVSQGKTGINKSWFYRYTIGRTGRSVGLGAYPRVPRHAASLLGFFQPALCSSI
jgi:hypothetical protein